MPPSTPPLPPAQASPRSGGASTHKVCSYDTSCAWQPACPPSAVPDQSPAAMAAALCALRALSRAALPAATAAYLLAAFHRVAPFPPAVAALRLVLRGLQLRDADKVKTDDIDGMAFDW